jgi:anaerobic magnesium-protoporphyrin IX monomethyl ester cyclase
VTDLLLTHAYFLWEDEKEREIMKPYAPLGLLYISAYLKRAGFDVETFDTTFSDRESLVARLAATPGGVIGVYTNLMTRANAIWIAEQAHLHRWTVIFGGPESANYPDDYIERGADVVVLGEGENTLEELLPVMRDRGPHRLHGVAGTVFRDEDGIVVHNDPREKVSDIDSLPWPDREAIDMAQYVDTWRTHHGMGSVNLITARGCPYKCNWCSHAVFGYSHRRRNPIDCVDEVQHIVERYKPEQVWYADDVFTISHKWLFEYADEMKRRNMRIPFETISRADRMKKEEVLASLAELGCYRIWIGSESGSQRILDAMQRGVKVEEVQFATKMAKKYGIEVGMFLMWGYEGEELSDIEATIEHVKESNPDIFFTTVAYPIKNTGYYEKVKKKLIFSSDWNNASDRELRVVGRHTKKYYKHADSWLNNAVAAHRLVDTDPAAAALKADAAEQARLSLLACADEVDVSESV